MSFLPPLVDVQQYKAFEAKLVASVRWLITRVFDKEIPDKLKQVVFVDQENRVVLSVAVQTALTNGSLYGQAAARIFKDGTMLQHRVDTLLMALSQAGHAVSYRAAGVQMLQVTEAMLYSAEPFDQMAHIAMIDAMMGLYVRRTCTIERAIQAVGQYTSVEDQERPMDSTDALLFWINKICLLIRDDVEKTGQPLKGGADGASGVIPEMEDLYEDLCDGCCAAALIAFYFPQRLELTEICFNDPMSMTDCQYNLLLIQRFCDSMPSNPWHFSTEDVLYMHESMQVNINAFLTDLFDFFEPSRAESVEPMPVPLASTTTPRRFVPVQGIPDLRAANVAARPNHPPKTNRFGGVLSGSRPPRSMSVMSADSLTGARPAMPLSARLQQEQQWGGQVTAFGQMQQPMDQNGSGMASFAAPGASPIHSTTVTTSSPYSRSDSLPAASMSIRLALEEKRREHTMKKVLASTATEAERQEKSKAAFFALMSKHAKNSEAESSSLPPEAVASTAATDMMSTLSKQVHDLQAKLDMMTMERESERLTRATSQPSIYHDVSGSQSARPFSNSGGAAAIAAGHFQQPYTGASTQNEFYYSGMQQGQPTQQQYGGYEQPQFHPMRPSLSNGVLNYQQQMHMQQQQPYDGYGQNQGYYTMQPGQMHHMQQAAAQMQQQPPQQQIYGMPSVMHQSAHAAFSLHSTPQHQATPPPRPPSTGPLQQPPMPQMPNSMSYPTQIAPPPQYNEAIAMQHQQHVPQPHQMIADSTPQQPAAAVGDGGFRLHQSTTPVSRLDPPLELNRNLTNWGLTYRQGQQRSRRTWENETFVKSEHDLVNQPENVPYAEEASGVPQQSPAPISSITRSSRSREDTPASVASAVSGGSRLGGSESEGPPRDPTATSSRRESNGEELTSGGRRTPSGLGESGGTGFVVEAVGDDAAAQDFDNMRMQAKRDALLAKTMKRKEEITQKVDTIEARNAERRAAERAKQEMADQRKIEKEIQRQKILDEYKKKKVEKELGLDSARSVSSVGRGSSQPPFARTKSQGLTDTPRLPSGGTTGTLGRARGQSNVDDVAKKISVPSCAEPSLKLFAKAVPKSNRNLINNALQFSVFPGAVSADSRNKVLNELSKSAAKHVLLLFRDHKCQYRGLYEWDQVSDTVARIHGTGPKMINEPMMQMMFKYESGGKVFNHIPTKHLSATIDGFTIKDEFWQKAKIPHSGAPAPAHRLN